MHTTYKRLFFRSEQRVRLLAKNYYFLPPSRNPSQASILIIILLLELCYCLRPASDRISTPPTFYPEEERNEFLPRYIFSPSHQTSKTRPTKTSTAAVLSSPRQSVMIPSRAPSPNFDTRRTTNLSPLVCERIEEEETTAQNKKNK